MGRIAALKKKTFQREYFKVLSQTTEIVFEKFSGSITMHRVRKEVVNIRTGIESELARRVDQRVLRWFVLRT